MNAHRVSLDILSIIIEKKLVIPGNQDNVEDSTNLLNNINAYPMARIDKDSSEASSWIIPTVQHNDLASLAMFRYHCKSLKQQAGSEVAIVHNNEHLKIEFLHLNERSDHWKSSVLEDYDWVPNSGAKTLPSNWKNRLAILELLRDFFMERGMGVPYKVISPTKE